MQIISLIAALERKGGIGNDGKIPWHLPADLAHFKRVTMGRPIVMGRKTYESIGKSLPGRRNIVLSRRPDFRANDCDLAYSLKDGLRMAGDGEVFVIGGGAVYREALPLAHKLYLTRVDADFPADTFFPQFDEGQWSVVDQACGLQDAKNSWAYEFLVLERLR